MIFGKLAESTQLSYLLKSNAWKQAFDWLSELSGDSPCGNEERLDGKLKIGIDSYSPRLLEGCRFESHHEFIDLQFSLSGGELIHCLNNDQLGEEGPYDSTRDVQFFKSPPSGEATILRMKPERFAVFFPEDAHCPQIEDGENTISKKAVLKVHTSLLM
jgi:YhcH/YjgK/YiaL family protein